METEKRVRSYVPGWKLPDGSFSTEGCCQFRFSLTHQEVTLLSEKDYCRMETWYKDIAKVTFQSQWFDLTEEQATAMLEKRDLQRWHT